MTLLSFTANAITQLKVLLDKRGKPSLGIRIGVKSGGCSGKTYHIEYADTQNQYDEIITQNGITILIDPKVLMYVIGSEVDYVDTKFKSGFQFYNPNEQIKCGCGKSFDI